MDVDKTNKKYRHDAYAHCTLSIFHLQFHLLEHKYVFCQLFKLRAYFTSCCYTSSENCCSYRKTLRIVESKKIFMFCELVALLFETQCESLVKCFWKREWFGAPPGLMRVAPPGSSLQGRKACVFSSFHVFFRLTSDSPWLKTIIM